MENNENPYFSNKDYKKVCKKRLKLNNNNKLENKKLRAHAPKLDTLGILENNKPRQYFENKPIVYDIQNYYNIHSGTHKWLIKE